MRHSMWSRILSIVPAVAVLAAVFAVLSRPADANAQSILLKQTC